MGAHASNVPLDNVGREGNGKVDFVVLVSIILVGNILIFVLVMTIVIVTIGEALGEF